MAVNDLMRELQTNNMRLDDDSEKKVCFTSHQHLSDAFKIKYTVNSYLPMELEL